MLGNGRLECFCFDGVKRQATIRGKLRKKVWMNVGDVVLVSLRSYQDEKCDVIHKYQPDEVRKLKNKGEIPESLHINEEDGENIVQRDNDVNVQFEENSSEDDDKDIISSSDEEQEEENSEEEEEEEDEDEAGFNYTQNLNKKNFDYDNSKYKKETKKEDSDDELADI